MRLEATGLTFVSQNKLYCIENPTFYWGDDCMARFGKIAAIGCLIPIGLVALIPLFAWGCSKFIDIDSKWIKKGISDAFEKEEFSFDAQFEFHQEGSSSEDITSLILLGTLKQKSLFGKELPVALQTKDNGNTWKMVNNSIGADSDFRDGAESWEYFGVALLNGKIGKVYSNVKDSVSSFGKSIILEKRSTYNKHFGDCSSELVFAQEDPNWFICGYDNKYSSAHEIRILHKTEGSSKIQSSFPNKWHLFRTENGRIYDFHVKGNMMAAAIVFDRGPTTWLHYLYYSVDGGKNWKNEKLPNISDARLVISDNKIAVLGLENFYNEGWIRVHILTMPNPKK